MIEVIAATRYDQAAFQRTPLGLSLCRLQPDTSLVPRITFSNALGLPRVYNSRIEAKSDSDILLFIHDDVWIDDFFLTTRIVEGLQRFQIIGVAGNRRLAGSHVGWAFKNPQWEWDYPHLSGVVAHGATPFGNLSIYGEVPSECELLDGVFLATRRSHLLHHRVRFDPRFQFNFYDLDFCRTARGKGMTIGTWPIAITHGSNGFFESTAWQEGLAAYKAKWSDTGMNDV
jgi:hypothetical protein